MKSLFRRLREHWKIVLFAGCFTPLFIYLGAWQLARSDEKASLMARMTIATEAKPSPHDWQSEVRPERLTVLRIKGEFIPNRQVLYDNQIYHGRFGYRVFTPFCEPAGASCLLVERGWMAGDVDRSKLPSPAALATPEGVIEIAGHVDRLQPAPLITENTEADARATLWPRRVQMMVDPPVLLDGLAGAISGLEAQQLSVRPWVLRMSAASPGALQAFWTPTVMSAARHTGYAVQWFAMALALIVLTIWQIVRRSKA